jgi:arabinogalactan oligomer/maltooligosaccharide transport system permease protein
VLAELFSMPPVGWLSHPQLALVACLVTNIWLGFPFMMMVALGGLQAIPPAVYESAQLDGASFWQRTRHMTLPLLLPVMAPAIALSAFWTFNQFNVIWLVSNGGEPADQTHILVSFIYKSAFNLYRYSFAAAYSFLLFVFLFGLAFFVYRFALPKWGSK